jgi:deoxyadenosine/deoxycytidine kinase
MSSPKSNPKIERRRRIVIDGNIGSGKTTQLNILSKLGYKVNCEPIDEWPLDLFYRDKDRWAFLLQMSILKSFLDKDGLIWERSPESSREVFWKMLNQGTPEEERIYKYFYEKYSWSPDIHIYIRTDPEICLQRILSRNQTGDTRIDMEYISKVHMYYENYVSSRSTVHIIDGNNSSPEEIHTEILRCITQDAQV